MDPKMATKKKKGQIFNHITNNLNVTSNVINLARLILKEVFGEVVESLAGQLLQWNDQHLGTLLRGEAFGGNKGKQEQQKLCEALVILIHHNLVTFSRNTDDRYTLNVDQVLNLIHYPRYMILSKTLFGDEGEILTEELLSRGQDCASNLIYRATRRLAISRVNFTDQHKEISEILNKLHTAFIEMTKCHFIGRVGSPYLTTPDVEEKCNLEGPHTMPKLDMPQTLKYQCPNIDFKAVLARVNKNLESSAEEEAKEEKTFLEVMRDGKILWKVNASRIHREFRDLLIVQAVQRRIDTSAGNLMRVMLTLMNETSPWLEVSTHIHQVDILSRIQAAPKTSAAGADDNLQKYHNQYLKVLEEDRTRFCDRVGDAGGGQYVINVKHIFTELASATADNIVLEKFGSKALRIFRVIREKLHVEESQLPGYVMIPAKEIKLLTYQLLENNFIQLQELRKSMANNAPTKSFYLFYVDLNQVARMVAEMCRKALANSFTRKNYEATQNKRLLDKQEKIESIAVNLKASGELEESDELQLQLQEIQDMLSPVERETAKRIHERMDQLGRAATQIDDTLFVMNMFLRFNCNM